MESKLKEIIKQIVKEIQSEEELEEITTTGAVAGYQTPAAFTKPGKEKEKNKRISKATFGWEMVDEGVNRWNQLRKEESTPNQKIGIGIRNLRRQMDEMEKFLEWYGKIKNENNLQSAEYWKRTQKHLNAIRERLNKISAKITNLSV